MWEVFFNTYNKNPDIEARSAGTAIKWDGKINPKVKDLLNKHGIDIENQERVYEPKVITEEMVQNAELVFTMGCMDGDMIWERPVDYDFGLNDPARDDTDVDVMFASFETQIQQFLEKYNS